MRLAILSMHLMDFTLLLMEPFSQNLDTGLPPPPARLDNIVGLLFPFTEFSVLN